MLSRHSALAPNDGVFRDTAFLVFLNPAGGAKALPARVADIPIPATLPGRFRKPAAPGPEASLVNAKRWRGNADRRRRTSRIISHHRPDTTHAFLVFLVVEGVPAMAHLPQFRFQFRGGGQGVIREAPQPALVNDLIDGGFGKRKPARPSPPPCSAPRYAVPRSKTCECCAWVRPYRHRASRRRRGCKGEPSLPCCTSVFQGAAAHGGVYRSAKTPGCPDRTASSPACNAPSASRSTSRCLSRFIIRRCTVLLCIFTMAAISARLASSRVSAKASMMAKARSRTCTRYREEFVSFVAILVPRSRGAWMLLALLP